MLEVQVYKHKRYDCKLWNNLKEKSVYLQKTGFIAFIVSNYIYIAAIWHISVIISVSLWLHIALINILTISYNFIHKNIWNNSFFILKSMTKALSNLTKFISYQHLWWNIDWMFQCSPSVGDCFVCKQK